MINHSFFKKVAYSALALGFNSDRTQNGRALESKFIENILNEIGKPASVLTAVKSAVPTNTITQNGGPS